MLKAISAQALGVMFRVFGWWGSRLVQRWVDYMLGALVTSSQELQEKVTPLLDNLTCQLLALCECLHLPPF